MKYLFNIVMYQDTCEPICFKRGVIINDTKLYCLNVCSHSVVKLREAAQMFEMVHFVKEMTVKKFCKYGAYGSFGHLHFVFYP